MKYTLNLFITNYVVNDKGLCENDRILMIQIIITLKLFIMCILVDKKVLN